MNNAAWEAPLIRIDSEVTRRVRRHARAHMQTEVCGVLVGHVCDGVLEIEAPIEAFNASQAGAHVTFTQAAWETIYRVKDKSYPDDRIVGWYHSHPGFGVFLSDHDTFIHRNFFSSPDQVAWVFDPHSDEEGCFGWIDGSIRRIASIYIADNSGGEPQRPSKRMQSECTPPQWTVRPARPGAKLKCPPPDPRNHSVSISSFAARLSGAVFVGVGLGRSLMRLRAPVAAGLPASQPAVSPEESAALAKARASDIALSETAQPVSSESGQ